MFWEISFWLLAVLIIVPFLFKIYGYITRRDNKHMSSNWFSGGSKFASQRGIIRHRR